MPSFVPRFYDDLRLLAWGLLTSVLAFALVVAGVSGVVPLLPFVVGVPLALGWAWLLRGMATVERHRAAIAPGRRPVPAAYRPQPGGVLARARVAVADPQSWRDLAHLTLHAAVGFATSVAGLTVAACGAGLVAWPLWSWALPSDAALYDDVWALDSWWADLLQVPIGLVVLAVSVVLCRGCAALQVGLAQGLLRPVSAPLSAHASTR